MGGRRTALLLLLRVNRLALHDLRRLSGGLRVLQLSGLLGRLAPDLSLLLEVLAWVRLRLRLRRHKLLAWLILYVLRRYVVRRVVLCLLRSLLVLVLVIVRLLRTVLSLTVVQLSVVKKRAWHVLRVEGLVLVGILGGLDTGLVALVLLGLRGCLLLLRLLGALTLVLVGAVLRQLRYPALGLIASLSAHPVEWGPIVLLLVRRRHKLLLLLLVLHVLGWYLGRVARVLLQKGIQVVLFLLVRRRQMRAGPLVLILL